MRPGGEPLYFRLARRYTLRERAMNSGPLWRGFSPSIKSCIQETASAAERLLAPPKRLGQLRPPPGTVMPPQLLQRIVRPPPNNSPPRPRRQHGPHHRPCERQRTQRVQQAIARIDARRPAHPPIRHSHAPDHQQRRRERRRQNRPAIGLSANTAIQSAPSSNSTG